MTSVVRKIAGTDPRTNAVGQAHPDMHSVVDRRYLGLDTDFSMRLTSLPFELLDLNAAYTRNSVRNVVQNGALVALTANQFGTSYDPVTGLYGYVPEPAATNLATNSDGAATTYTVSNVVDGTAVTGLTNGLAFGDNSVQRSATKSISVTSGTNYSVSFFVIMDDGNAPVVGTTNSTGDFSITLNAVIATTKLERVIGSNVYRVSASIAASATASHAAGCIKYTGQSARTFRITGIQVETGLRATSYIATAGSTASRAADVLTVPLWVNNVKDSQDGSTANWTRTNCTVTTSGTAPDGSATAQLLTASSTTSITAYNNSCKAPSTNVTASIYVKAGNKPTAIVGLRNNTTSTLFQIGTLTFATGAITGTGWTATDVGNGWFRCVFTQSTGISVGDTLYIYPMASPTLTTGDTQYFWGAQIEPGSVATTYRPTTSTLESAANANIPGFSSAGYTLAVDGRFDVQTATERGLISVDDGTANNRAQIRQSAANLVSTAVVSGGVAQASNAETSVAIARYKAAFSVSAGSFLRAVNGSAGTADTSGSTPVSTTLLQLGKNHQTDIANGFIFRAQLITTPLTQAQLNGLTT